MKANKKVLRILEEIQEGKPLSQHDCAFLLQFPETSLEAAMLRAIADDCSRQRYANNAYILGQIGIEIAACPGRCGFCGFGEGHTLFDPQKMSLEEIIQSAENFTKSRELFALVFMTMHEFDFDHLVQTLQSVRESIPKETQIIVNIGDFDRSQALELKASGVNGAYHILRLREGIDSAISPEQRKATIRHIKESGMDWYYCCEPIGPEHTPDELAERIFLGIEFGCAQHAAMRRVFIPTSPLARHGQITELRLAQTVAAVTLASLQCPETQSICVHEPNLLGLLSGANAIYAETGANPRDANKNTLGNRGRDIGSCKLMLYEAGFTSIVAPFGRLLSLNEAYRQ
jgi:biotin synthase